MPLTDILTEPAAADVQQVKRCSYDPFAGQQCWYEDVPHTHPTQPPPTLPPTLPCGITGPRADCDEIEDQLITGTTAPPTSSTAAPPPTAPPRCDTVSGVHSHDGGTTCHPDHPPCRLGQHRDDGHDDPCHPDHPVDCVKGPGEHRHASTNTCHNNHSVPDTCGTR